MSAPALLVRRRATFRAVAEVVVPDLLHADDAAWREVETTVAHALSARPARMLMQLEALLRLIGLLSRLRFRRPLHRVDLPRRERFLLRLQRSSPKLVRRGVWGLRTLVLMGHYTRPVVMSSLGYRADKRGWSARSGAP